MPPPSKRSKTPRPSARQLAVMAEAAVTGGTVKVMRCPTAAATFTTGQNIDVDILRRIAERQPTRTLADTIREGITEYQNRHKGRK